MRVVLFLALAYLSSAQEEESCTTDVQQDVDQQKGLLQTKRLRDQMSIGEGASLTDRKSLLEMKAQLAAKLDRKEAIKPNERGFLNDFREWIRNTSLKYIREGATETQKLVDTEWGEVVACDTALENDQTSGTWKLYKEERDNAGEEHKTCRTVEEEPLWIEVNQSCTTLNKWVKRLVDPAQTFGTFPEGGTTEVVATWLQNFWNWHCKEPKKEDYFEKQSTTECKPDMEKAENKHEECNDDQADFEEKWCKFKDHVVSECSKYNQCRKDKEDIYKESLKKLLLIDGDRKVEWQILNVIICYIGLLLGDSGKELTEENKKACEDGPYPFPEDSIITYPGTEDGVLIPGFNQSDCSLTAPDPVIPSPCEPLFISGQYGSFPADAPATTCGLTRTCPGNPSVAAS